MVWKCKYKDENFLFDRSSCWLVCSLVTLIGSAEIVTHVLFLLVVVRSWIRIRIRLIPKAFYTPA